MNALSANDKLTIFMNVAAKFGMKHPNLISEYAKALHVLHGVNTMNAMNSQAAMQQPPVNPEQSGLPVQPNEEAQNLQDNPEQNPTIQPPNAEQGGKNPRQGIKNNIQNNITSQNNQQ